MQRFGSLIRGLLGLLAALIFVSFIAIAGVGQGFNQPGSFGDSEETRVFEPAHAPDEGATATYFIHDQLIKIAIVGGLSLFALVTLLMKGFKYRKWILLLPIVLVGFYLGGILCPLSSVQNVFLKWNTGYLLLFLIPVVLALTVGRVFCGYVCPFGAMQELLHVGKWHLSVPARWRKLLGFIKYGLLIFLVTRVLVTGTGIWQGLTPFKAVFEWGGSSLAIAGTILFAALSVVLWRPFCEVFCPLGALLSLLSRVSVFKLEATGNCISCGQCTSRCSALACKDGKISSADCFLCGDCVRVCPLMSVRLARRRPSN